MLVATIAIFLGITFSSSAAAQPGGWSKNKPLTDDLVQNASSMVQVLLDQAGDENKNNGFGGPKFNFTLIKIISYRTQVVQGENIQIKGYYLECMDEV